MIEFAIIIFLVLISIFVIYYINFSPSTQILGPVVFVGKTKNKIVALTFDDGPNEPYTSQILNILKQHNVKATFFPVGENIIRHKSIIMKMKNDGHVIGNHSFSHAFFAPIFSPDFKDQIVRSQKVIENVTGQAPVLFRPPWFFRTKKMLQTARKLGFTTITGTFASNWEVFKVNPNKIANDAFRRTHPGTILVFHDGYNNKKTDRTKTVEAIRTLIPKLLKVGYKFVTVPELFGK